MGSGSSPKSSHCTEAVLSCCRRSSGLVVAVVATSIRSVCQTVTTLHWRLLCSCFCAAGVPFDHMVSLLGYQCPRCCFLQHPTALCQPGLIFPERGQLIDLTLLVWGIGVLSNGETGGSSCRLPNLSIHTTGVSAIVFKPQRVKNKSRPFKSPGIH